ncbi:trypsin-like peptidase domain-containing protein [Patescibacteria group bacterium]|nr:trypsin-like peptidase domain-containing protein [Patescibacteria group bacterium]MBU4367584.1 trypsin-like peptidase domain-containing protein [Patescibacteria group bacterium]MBU4461624.1 trypsin-like peptidase domain-containing protein [Patescibacteria group bacterium]MCG2699522.1 trypsin-like peptidase domain-containing protein [Candidatus Parcubacteria bacterium]
MAKKISIVEIAKRACPAVITIVVSKDLPKIEGFYMFPFGGKEYMMPNIQDGNKKRKTQIGGGSGFIISKDGYVITSNHVVADTTAKYTVILEPKKKYSAKILSRNPINDVAILKIEEKNLPYLELADSSKIELGEEVVAIGNALGEFHDTLSAGIVSGLSRYITAISGLSQQAENLRGLIQTDAAINPGNSGGPLVNMEGKVIGINTAVVMGAQNIGFAIPIDYAKKDLEEIKKYGKIIVPFLGIKYVLISEEMARVNKLPVHYGALVVRETLGEPPVIKDSPAEKTGVKEFDIILECRGEKITLKNPLANILQKCKIGEKATLKILREKQEIDLVITLEEKK